MNVTTAETPQHSKIDLLTSAGTFSSYIINHDGHIGIRTEFVANEDCGDKPGRPSVSLEFDEDGELGAFAYDRTSEDPVSETAFKNGVICQNPYCETKEVSDETSKERFVTLVLKDQDGLDVRISVMRFFTSLPDDGIIPAIMAASQDYLNTEEGRKVWENNCHTFNYGDFDIYVGNKFCIPHGITRIDDAGSAIEEDFNTTLAVLDDDAVDLFALFNFGKSYPKIQVTGEDVDDIMESAMTGCAYWCKKVEPVDGYLGEYASEQISRYGMLKFYPADDKPVNLTPENFREGLYIWLKTYIQGNSHNALRDGRLDPGQMDACDADCIIQYALFGEIRYA